MSHQLRHKWWVSSTTLRNEDGSIVDQKNRWGIDGMVKHPNEYPLEADDKRYHTFEVDYYFVFLQWPIGLELTPVTKETYRAHRIGDYIKRPDPLVEGHTNQIPDRAAVKHPSINPYKKNQGY